MKNDPLNFQSGNGWTSGQYSVFRIFLGIYLFVHFIHLIPYSTELFSNQGVLPSGRLSPLSFFPMLYSGYDAPWFVQGSLILAALAAFALTIGWQDRLAALWIGYVLASLFCRNPLIANPSLPYVGFMMLAHLFVPRTHYGSITRKTSAEFIKNWELHSAVFLSAWIVLAASYSYSGYTKLLSPSWVAGDTIEYVLQNPLARPWALQKLMLWLPPIFLTLLTWFVLYVELFFLPLAAWKPLRKWLWLTMLVIQFGFLFLLNFADLTIGMLLFHLFTFNPKWIAARPFIRNEVLYYDGHCALCHGFIRFLLAEENTGALRYAPLQGEHFTLSIPAAIQLKLPDSLVLQVEPGQWLVKSDAVIYVLRHIGGLWFLLSYLLAVFPRWVRDGGYDLVGKLRYRLFGQSSTLCPVVPIAFATRFIIDAEK